MISVDLPAPLSPRTHVTWPALTTVETSFSAITLPKYFEMLAHLEQRRVGGFWPLLLAVLIAGPLRAPADVGVHQHRGEQDHAEEQEAPVGVPARELDPDERHADDQRAHRGADRRPEAARQQAAAGDRGDDVGELLADALAGLHGPEAQRDHDAHERRARSRPS